MLGTGLSWKLKTLLVCGSEDRGCYRGRYFSHYPLPPSWPEGTRTSQLQGPLGLSLLTHRPIMYFLHGENVRRSTENSVRVIPLTFKSLFFLYFEMSNHFPGILATLDDFPSTN